MLDVFSYVIALYIRSPLIGQRYTPALVDNNRLWLGGGCNRYRELSYTARLTPSRLPWFLPLNLFCFDLQVTEILEIAQEAKPEKRSILHKNIASLRKEKDNWKNFMELDERNKETVLEVEAAWRKRYVYYVEFSLDSLSVRFLSIIWFGRQVLFSHQ